ncbi:MAG: cobalamin-binding protein [Acidobacteria bacterium]|nr:MAG: cobalamin-binding protein [Acidobacteriota bacterium]
MHIVSLLPAATEILYAVGAGDSVVGVTHECDFPAEAAAKPRLIRPRLDASVVPAEVERQVRELIGRRESIYALDAELLLRLQPDLIVTQDLCDVCAASAHDIAAALSRFPAGSRPQVVSFTPRNLEEVWKGIREIAKAAEHDSEGQALAEWLALEVAAVEQAVAELAPRPKVLCLEWFDPPYMGGHWVPEMVRLAGGIEVLGREGEPSFPVPWRDALSAQPEIVILMSCGYNLERNINVWRSTKLPPGWNEIPAVRNDHIYAVDANAYFSRPGPRLTEGVALLAALLHPTHVRTDLARQQESVRRVPSKTGSLRAKPAG